MGSVILAWLALNAIIVLILWRFGEREEKRRRILERLHRADVVDIRSFKRVR